jgi:8-oxo-dGTP diphosphatase
MVRRRIGEGDLRWQFPGGAPEPGESDSKAVEREVYEETGISCKATTALGEWRHPDTARPVSYWGCEYISGEVDIREPEVLDRVEWIRFSAVAELITTEVFPGVRNYLQDN